MITLLIDVTGMVLVEKETKVIRSQMSIEASQENGEEQALPKMLDAVLFVVVLAFAAVALVALALGAPLILAVSALAGIFTSSTAQGLKARNGWRAVKAS